MSIGTSEWTGPISSAEVAVPDLDRAVDIEQKHRLVAGFLESHRYDALLLQKPDNVAWFTAGAEVSRGGSSESAACLFITPEARVILTTNVDSPQLFECDLPGLGFQLKERPWHEPRHLLVEDLCRGRAVASDTGLADSDDVSVHLTGMRIPLSGLDCERLRGLGRRTAHAVEAVCRRLTPGRTEAEIAGEVAHRLLKRQISVERVQVWGDLRGERFRHRTYGPEPVERCGVIAVVARQGGLCVGCSRSVSFGEPPAELRAAHARAVLVQATGMYFSQSDWELFEVWNRVQRIYEKFDCAEEWHHAEQAELIGYGTCEVPVVPRSEYQLAAGMAVHWHPCVGPALAADSILVADRGFELLTPMEDWPRLVAQIKGTPVPRPDILRLGRDGGEGNGNDSTIAGPAELSGDVNTSALQ